MAARRARAAAVAVSGGDVLKGGCLAAKAEVGELPKVGEGEEEGRLEGKRKRKRKMRPGKKRRIYVRVKRAVEFARMEARRKSNAGREKYVGLTPEQRDEVARQERARKSREKKARERAKKKAKKEKEKENEAMQV